jgi:hypothetical protein
VNTKWVWSRIVLLTLMAVGLRSAAFAQALDALESPAIARTQVLELPEPPAPRLQIRESATLSRPTGWSAPALHASLAATFVGLQAVDVATTLHAVRSGKGIEANPLVGGLANHPAAFVAVKGALVTATVLSINSLSKKHPKGAVFAMIGLNAASAWIVRSNVNIVTAR